MGIRAVAARGGMAAFVAAGVFLSVDAASASAPVVELGHDMDVRFHDTYATVKVRRTVSSDHVDGVEARLSIDTEHPMAATGLATRADDGRWYAGELMDVHDAVDTYWKLTGSKKVVPEGELPDRMPRLRPKDPALLMWQPYALELYVYPVVEGSPKAVEYTLQIPYAYEGGAEVLHLPVGDADDLPPKITFGRTPRAGTVTAEGMAVAEGTTLVPSSTGEVAVRIEPTRRDPLTVTLSSTRADKRHMARLAVSAGPQLGPDPARTHAVIVLDRSRSLGDDSFVAAQRAVQAYLTELDAVPGAKVQIVGFARKAQALQTGFVAPNVAAGDLRDAGWDLRNGSELDAALQLAAARLAKAPAGAPRRVIVVSDTAVTESVAAAATARLSKMSAVVHLADITGARYTGLARDPKHPWGDVVAGTGGVAWQGVVDAVDGRTGQIFSDWVRPQRIEDLTVELDGADLRDSELGEIVLEAGAGMLDVDLYDRVPRVATVRGVLWGRSIVAKARRSSRTDKEFSITAAAYLGGEMTDAEIRDVALRAHAASPQTALLALEPDASPGQAIDGDLPVASRVFSTSCGVGGGPLGDFGRYSLTFDEAELIRDEVASAIDACGATGEHVSVGLTTTYAEITDVDRVDIEGKPELAACVRDELWTIEFPPGQHGPTRHEVEHEPL